MVAGQPQPFMKSLHPSSCRLGPEQTSCFFGLQASSVYICSPSCPLVIRPSSGRGCSVVGLCRRLLLIVEIPHMYTVPVRFTCLLCTPSCPLSVTTL